MLKRIILFLTIIALQGCALTRTEVEIPYLPQTEGAMTVSGSLILGVIEDKRAVEDPAVLFNKRNMYNNTMSGSYAAKRPVADYVRDGVEAFLNAAGVDSENAKLTLTGTLEEFEDELVMGMWTSTLNTKMLVRFTLRSEDGQVVWTDMVIGRGVIKKGNFVKQALTVTADDVARQLLENEGFRSALKTHR